MRSVFLLVKGSKRPRVVQVAAVRLWMLTEVQGCQDMFLWRGGASLPNNWEMLHVSVVFKAFLALAGGCLAGMPQTSTEPARGFQAEIMLVQRSVALLNHQTSQYPSRSSANKRAQFFLLRTGRSGIEGFVMLLRLSLSLSLCLARSLYLALSLCLICIYIYTCV